MGAGAGATELQLTKRFTDCDRDTANKPLIAGRKQFHCNTSPTIAARPSCRGFCAAVQCCPVPTVPSSYSLSESASRWASVVLYSRTTFMIPLTTRLPIRAYHLTANQWLQGAMSPLSRSAVSELTEQLG